MENIEYTYTYGMDEAAVERRLRETETGVLGLARDGEAYAIPVAFHFDGERVLLRLGEHDRSRKLAFVEATTEASLLLYEYAGPRESWSVVVTGELAPVSLAEAGMTAADVNEAFPPLRVFGEDVEALEPALFELRIAEITGRRTEP